MVEYRQKASSGVSKAALATAVGAGVVALSNGTGLGGLLGGGLGGAPVARAYATAAAEGLVSDRDLYLVREIGAKDAVIAKLEAEKYADYKVQEATAPLAKRVCDLEAAQAMEVERRRGSDRELLTYVDGNFIKAHKRISSADIDYDGCEPVIRRKRCCCGNHGGSAPVGEDEG